MQHSQKYAFAVKHTLLPIKEKVVIKICNEKLSII